MLVVVVLISNNISTVRIKEAFRKWYTGEQKAEQHLMTYRIYFSSVGKHIFSIQGVAS